MRSPKPYAILLLGLMFTGCNDVLGNRPSKPVDSLCEWLADECNCYRRFAAGVANSTVTTVNQVSSSVKPLCGVQLDSNRNAINSETNELYAPAEKPTIGTFLSREKLDVCILTGEQGGQIVFDPPLDVLAFPPASMTFKMLDAFGQICGNGSFAGPTTFSISFPAPEGIGGAGGAGGSAAGGNDLTCRGESRENNEDPGREAITSGTFSITATDPTNIVDTVCPNDEKHRFNLLQLEKCDGVFDGVSEENYKALLPTVEVYANAGGVNVPGEVRLHISWPRSEPVDSLNGARSIQVEYFDCLFPGSIHPCQNGVQDGVETDVDCGFVACGVGCPDGANCTMGQDCTSGLCTPNENGLKKCVFTPCGDGAQNGSETCDDGNAQAGDGCSATCQQEPGYTCMGAGLGSCVDIDECAEMTDNCDASATCINLPGSFKCECAPGFSGDGISCTAGCGNSVMAGPEQCDDANMVSGDGCSANCVVEPGYKCMGDGPASCVDIDECAMMEDNCLDTEDCSNTSGSFTCTCKPGNVVCNGVCLDVSADLFNCGNCDVVCLPGQVCTAGVCIAP